MPRPECGSSRCTCDHTLCDCGWFEVPALDATGKPTTAVTKCLHCFPPAEPVEADPLGRARRRAAPTDARSLGAEYADHAAAAAGDR